MNLFTFKAQKLQKTLNLKKNNNQDWVSNTWPLVFIGIVEKGIIRVQSPGIDQK